MYSDMKTCYLTLTLKVEGVGIHLSYCNCFNPGEYSMAVFFFNNHTVEVFAQGIYMSSFTDILQ
jgi:hypothetical protein